MNNKKLTQVTLWFSYLLCAIGVTAIVTSAIANDVWMFIIGMVLCGISLLLFAAIYLFTDDEKETVIQ